MASRPAIPKRDAERARKESESDPMTAPVYRKPSSIGSWLVFVIALAIVGAIVYYVFVHKEQFGQLWHSATHPDSMPPSPIPGR